MRRGKNKNDQPTLASLRRERTLGQRAADRLTNFVGSWHFIIGIFVILAVWICLNIFEFIFRTWDPYPFILLNFFLSCLAAIEAPIILMSQNREEERDRQRQKYDYLINRKAEREIETLMEEVKEIKKILLKKKR
jgi:uncharacterized membrane protein